MTRATSSLVISRSLPATATTPRLLKERTFDPEAPTQARAICTPAMISASSAARLIASIVASTLTIFPLRVPRLAAAPLPMTSSAPLAPCSPIKTQILEVPMSQATRKLSGFAIFRTPEAGRWKAEDGRRRTCPGPASDCRLPTAACRVSQGIPGAVSAFEQDPIRETKVYGPRLPPAILNETPRFQERADLLRSVKPENSNRPSKDGIHHTETSVGECSNFGERGKIFGTAKAKVFQESDGFRQSVALAGHEHVLGLVGSRIVRSDRQAPGVEPPELPRFPQQGDRFDFHDANGKTVGKLLGECHALDPGEVLEPPGERREVERDEVRGPPRLESLQDLFGARAGVAGDVEPVEREERATEEPVEPGAAEKKERGEESGADDPARAPPLREDSPSPQKDRFAIHSRLPRDRPHPGARRPPRPSSRVGLRASRPYLTRQQPLSCQTHIRLRRGQRAWPPAPPGRRSRRGAASRVRDRRPSRSPHRRPGAPARTRPRSPSCASRGAAGRAPRCAAPDEPAARPRASPRSPSGDARSRRARARRRAPPWSRTGGRRP